MPLIGHGNGACRTRGILYYMEVYIKIKESILIYPKREFLLSYPHVYSLYL